MITELIAEAAMKRPALAGSGTVRVREPSTEPVNLIVLADVIRA